MYSSLEECCSALCAGKLAVLPTETVYGLAAIATEHEAVKKVFGLKGRPPNNPLIVHVLNLDMAKQVAKVHSLAEEIISLFWPGPLTLILPKQPAIPMIVTAGLQTVAVRQPAHPLFLKVLERIRKPIAAPSANHSNGISPTLAKHVLDDFESLCPPILDGGLCQHGLESTVLDLSTKTPKILRPGPISKFDIQKKIKIEFVKTPNFVSGDHTASKSPGNFSKHYSPKTPLHLKQKSGDLKIDFDFDSKDLILCYDSKDEKFFREKNIDTLRLSENGNPFEIAKNLYLTLQKADKLGKERIFAHLVDEDLEVAVAINDRLRRAAVFK